MEALSGKSPADSKGKNVVPEQMWLIQEEHCDHETDSLTEWKGLGGQKMGSDG